MIIIIIIKKKRVAKVKNGDLPVGSRSDLQ